MCIDSGKNVMTNTSWFNVSIPNPAPIVTINAPEFVSDECRVFINNSLSGQHINCSIQDTTIGVKNLTIHYNDSLINTGITPDTVTFGSASGGAPPTEGSAEWSISTSISEGSYEFYCYGYDVPLPLRSSVRSSSPHAWFVYDISAPDINLLSPSDEGRIATLTLPKEVEFRYSVDDNMFDYDLPESCNLNISCTLRLYNNTGYFIGSRTNTTSSARTITNTISLNQNWTYCYNVTCVDAAGNVAVSPTWCFNLTQDTSSSQVFKQSPKPNDPRLAAEEIYYTNENVTLVCNASDESGVDTLVLYTNISGSWDVSNSSSFSGLSPVYVRYSASFSSSCTRIVWNCWANDTLGNSAWADSDRASPNNYTVVYDTEAPIITLNKPIDGKHINSTITINFSVSDCSPISCNITIYDSTGHRQAYHSFDYDIYSSKEYSFDTSSWTEGLYYWNVSCVDAAGNLAESETRNLTLDRTAPIVRLIRPINSSHSVINITKHHYLNPHYTGTKAIIENGSTVKFVCNITDNSYETLNVSIGFEFITPSCLESMTRIVSDDDGDGNVMVNWTCVIDDSTDVCDISNINWSCSATDLAGNTGHNSKQIKIVPAPGPISPVNPEHNSNQNYLIQRFNWTGESCYTNYYFRLNALLPTSGSKLHSYEGWLSTNSWQNNVSSLLDTVPYEWKVDPCNNYICSNYSNNNINNGVWNFTVQSMCSFNVIKSNVSFNAITPGSSTSTLISGASNGPLMFNYTCNTEFSVNISDDGYIWATTSSGVYVKNDSSSSSWVALNKNGYVIIYDKIPPNCYNASTCPGTLTHSKTIEVNISAPPLSSGESYGNKTGTFKIEFKLE